MLNQNIQALGCLAHENLFKIYYLVFWFDSCIFWNESNKFSGAWLMKIEFESIQIILNIFKVVSGTSDSIQSFFESIQSSSGILW